MRFACALFVVGLFAACEDPAPETGIAESAPAPDSSDRPDRSDLPKIVAFGDSLTAGFGIGQDEAYPAVLQELLDAAGYHFEVINAGVSGDTSAGGVRRIDWVLEDRDVAVLILELGANDGLRGMPPSEMKKNLSAILDVAEARGIPVLLAGLSVGETPADRYLREFVGVYDELARERDVRFLPQFLDNVAGVKSLNQSDGKHPNTEGARVVAQNVFEALGPMLDQP